MRLGLGRTLLLLVTNPRQDAHEEWAIAQLRRILDLHQQSRDALPGSVIKLVKQAIAIMKKRRKTNVLER